MADLLSSADTSAIGAGDSYIIHNLMDPAESAPLFDSLLSEVTWQHMYHASGAVPRLVACQGTIDPTTGSMPIYRHPADHVLPLFHWTPTVLHIKTEAELRVGHDLNHVLVQLYRSGQDFISEHSDKTLDIAHESSIVNVSIGAQRTMRLRTKKVSDGAARQSQQVVLPHNSMFVMGLATNKVYLHSIKPDKRREAERDSAELAYGGLRISLTFRKLATFISHDSKLIWGQGATGKTEHTARTALNGDLQHGEAMVRAFGIENHEAEGFHWEENYGQGFDVLHLQQVQQPERPLLFWRESLGLDAELIKPPENIPSRPVYRDNDLTHTVITGREEILKYIHAKTYNQ